MEKILTVKDIAQRYKCSAQCARNYLRRMPHMEGPLAVYESDLVAWEQSRMTIPAGIKRSGPLVISRKREG